MQYAKCFLNQFKKCKTWFVLNYVKQNTTSVLCFFNYVKQSANNAMCFLNHIKHKTINPFCFNKF